MSQTVFDVPEAESPARTTLWLVVVNYPDDPHPHIESVETDEDDAKAVMDNCRAVTEPPHPSAWTLWKVSKEGAEQIDP